MAILNTNNLSVGYRQGKQTVALLQNLNLQLEQGRLVALLGQNGAGKSTLLRALSCSTSPVEGQIFINGQDVRQLSQRQLSRLIGLVATDRIQAGALTVTELVALGRQPHTGFLGRLSASDHELVAQAMADAGIAHKADSYVAQLSDGERQKVMIAKALAQQTPIIMLDEPTAFLDVASRIETMHLLRDLAHERGKAVLLSSHDVSQSLLLADDVWLITNERRVLAGLPRQLIANGAMNHVFSNPRITFSADILDYQLAEH